MVKHKKNSTKRPIKTMRGGGSMTPSVNDYSLDFLDIDVGEFWDLDDDDEDDSSILGASRIARGEVETGFENLVVQTMEDGRFCMRVGGNYMTCFDIEYIQVDLSAMGFLDLFDVKFETPYAEFKLKQGNHIKIPDVTKHILEMLAEYSMPVEKTLYFQTPWEVIIEGRSVLFTGFSKDVVYTSFEGETAEIKRHDDYMMHEDYTTDDRSVKFPSFMPMIKTDAGLYVGVLEGFSTTPTHNAIQKMWEHEKADTYKVQIIAMELVKSRFDQKDLPARYR